LPFWNEIATDKLENSSTNPEGLVVFFFLFKVFVDKRRRRRRKKKKNEEKEEKKKWPKVTDIKSNN
jgi:hypothetical protein